MPKKKRKGPKPDYTNAHEMHDVIEFATRELWAAEKRIDKKAPKPTMGIHIEVHPTYYAIVIRSFGLAFPSHRKCKRVTFGWIAEGLGVAENMKGLVRISQQVIETLLTARQHHDEIQAKKARRIARAAARLAKNVNATMRAAS